MIAGLEPISAGELSIGGKRMNETAAPQRGVAMVFQSYALYPHMSVYKNMSFGLRNGDGCQSRDRQAGAQGGRDPADHATARSPTQAALRQPEATRRNRPGHRAQAQDLPVRRAAFQPRCRASGQTRVEIAKLHTDIGATMVYVTHDQVEAMTLADRIVVLRAGVVEQQGTPLEIYNKPANRFVAGFIGSPKMNFLDVVATGHDDTRIRIMLAGSRLSIPVERSVVSGGKLTLGIRPEHILTAAGSEIDLGTLSLVHVEQLGGQTIAYGRLADDQALTVVLDGQPNISAWDTPCRRSLELPSVRQRWAAPGNWIEDNHNNIIIPGDICSKRQFYTAASCSAPPFCKASGSGGRYGHAALLVRHARPLEPRRGGTVQAANPVQDQARSAAVLLVKLTTIAGGNAPDIFQLEPGRFPDYSRPRSAPPQHYLSKVIPTDTLLRILDLGTVDGKVTVPLSLNPFALLPRGRCVQTGRDRPTDGQDTGPVHQAVRGSTKAIGKKNVWAAGNCSLSAAFRPG